MPKMTGQRNDALAELLDEDENGVVDEDSTSKVAYEEHIARVRAEADAQDKARRLVVAQQQLAEYAIQKEEDAAELLAEAEGLLSTLDGVGDEGLSTAEFAVIVENKVEALSKRIVQAAAEAEAFAAQHREDMERSKRSSAQADLPSNGTDMEMKRLRESGMVENGELDTDANGVEEDLAGESNIASFSGGILLERCKYIPLRLSYEERNRLRLLEAALNVSEYTDKVDILSWQSKNGRVHKQIQKICSILSGLVVAQDYRHGQRLIQSRDFCDNAHFFQDLFEIGRRYKIMNPDKMRAEYGKMMYMLMDSTDDSIMQQLGFECVCPLKTVYSFLKEKGGLQLLQDPLIEGATAEIIAGDRTRLEIQKEILAKERARESLARRYSSRTELTQEEILRCLYSISDNNSFLLYNRDPIDQMITYLKTYFNPESSPTSASLSISAGVGGARLSHSHERQYHYVLQTLNLWREISNDMFKLWYLADIDMLDSGHYYRLSDTGQGLNRVQQSPRVRKCILDIIDRCQRKIGYWVGSSVVHLGDHNVPNALMFIDKYTQVPRVLNPVVLTLDQIPKLYADQHVRHYIDKTFGSVEACRKSILVDCFRHAFDGSGADNFFDAGSCIDGRLTSAWNWCNKLEKKTYYHIFKLAGFVGFDGDFQK